MRKSDKGIGELSKALSVFQKNAPKIKKTKEGKIQLKSGNGYGYKYADLSDIWDAIRGPLADNKLSIIQIPTTQAGVPALTTLLSHETGEWIEDTMLLKIAQDTPQGQGSAITYARRYSLCSVLGIVADDDTDAQDHQTATTIQKKLIADTARKVMPELGTDPMALVRFVTEVVGKHPSRILTTEVDDAIQAIESYSKDQV